MREDQQAAPVDGYQEAAMIVLESDESAPAMTAAEPGWEKVTPVMDSGSAKHVGPPSMAKALPRAEVHCCEW